jgi:fatty-acyl-CoA synthase
MSDTPLAGTPLADTRHRLLSWLDGPRADRAVRLAEDDGTWSPTSYAELAARVRRVTAALRAQGVREGDTVAVIMPTGIDLVASIFAVWYAGAVVSVVVPPSLKSDHEYLAHITPILDAAAPVLTVCAAEHYALIGKATGTAAVLEDTSTGYASMGYASMGYASSGETVRPPADLALLQFTSGSSGTPKGVRVTWGNLADNLERIERTHDWRDGNGWASWLPLHHDMGFIGALLFPVSRQGNLWLLRPYQFIRDPARWLECFDRGRATHTATPSFGLAYAARKVKSERLAGLDLSGWRSVIIGAERVDAAALGRFAALTADTGFRAQAFQPAYGLAENTLLVCANPPDKDVRLVRPDWSRMEFGQPVPIEETMEFGPVEPGAGWLTGHGQADDVFIADDDGTPLPDGCLGEIVVRGASVAEGYHRLDSRTFSAGELRTSDAGFRTGGELYVLGRMGDSIKVSGRSVYMEDLDAKVASATGLNPAKLCVVGAAHAAGGTGVAVFAEARPGPWQDAASAFLRTELGTGPDIRIIAGTSGLIKRTSSGKPRRRHMWRILLSYGTNSL